jgi:hypothetical protein
MMAHEKEEVLETVREADQYVVIAINGEGLSQYTHARNDCLAIMLMEFFDRHPDIFDAMVQLKMANQISHLAEEKLGTEKAHELLEMLSHLMQGEADEEEDGFLATPKEEMLDGLVAGAQPIGGEEGDGSSMEEMKKFMDGLFKDNDTPN